MRDHMLGFAPIATFIADQMPDAPKPKKIERVRLTPQQEAILRFIDSKETCALSVNGDFPTSWEVTYKAKPEATLADFDPHNTWTDTDGNVSYLTRGRVYKVDTPKGIRFSRWEGEWMGRISNIPRARVTDNRALGPVLRVLGEA